MNDLIKVLKLADELDAKGLYHKADVIFEKIANWSPPSASPTAPQMLGPFQTSSPTPVNQNYMGYLSSPNNSPQDNPTNSLINKREQSGQYTGDTSEFNKSIMIAANSRFTLNQMYDQAVYTHGKNYANNLIAKYRTVHPDSGNAPVKPTQFQ